MPTYGTPTLTDRWDAVMMRTYGTPPIELARGSGVRVWDTDGREYLDFVGGIAVSALGHAHPAVVAAVSRQVSRLAHTSNMAIHEPAVAVAERLVEIVGGPARVFFGNSGAEANECALKLARKHGRSLDPKGGRLEIVAARGSFHGRTFATLAITGNPARRAPFEPLPGPVRWVDYGQVDSLWDALSSRTAAVILEPTLGAGIFPPPPGYLAAAQEMCQANGALFIVDEVQSGIGRTGNWFASIADGVRPDVLTVAKGLGGGLPISACIGFGPAATLLEASEHASTFGGNPVASAAALAVLTTIRDEHLLDSVKRVGDHLAYRLDAIDSPIVAGSRGSGLWRALALTSPVSAAIEEAARARGLLVDPILPDTVRMAPALVTTAAHVDDAVARLTAAIHDVRRRQR